MKLSCLIQKLDRMKQEGKFTRLTVLIAKTNSLQANLTQKFGCEIEMQVEGTNARKWKDLCKLGTQSQQCSKLKLGAIELETTEITFEKSCSHSKTKRHRKRQKTMNIFLEIIAPKASDKKDWPESRFLVIFGQKDFNFVPRKDAWGTVCCKVLKKTPQVCRISKSWCLGPWINVSSAATKQIQFIELPICWVVCSASLQNALPDH